MSKIKGEEKARVLALVDQGYTCEQIKAQMPHLLAQSIAGLYRIRKFGSPFMKPGQGIAPPAAPASPATAAAGLPDPTAPAAASVAEAAPTQPLMPPPAAAPPPAAPGEPSAPPGPRPTPSGPLSAVTPDRAARALETGLEPVVVNPASQPAVLPSWQEKYVITRINPPDGVVGVEYPPFDVTRLMDKYGGGEYEIDTYKNGMVVDRGRRKVAGAPKVVAPPSGDPAPGAASALRIPPPDPAETLLRTMDAVGKIEDRLMDKLDTEKGSKAQADAAVVQSAIGMARELSLKPPAVDDKTPLLVSKLFEIEAERTKAAEVRFQKEREIAELAHRQDMEREKARMDHEVALRKSETESIMAQQREYFERLGKLREEEGRLAREHLQRETEFIHKQAEKVDTEAKERETANQAWRDEQTAKFEEYRKRELEHIEEIRKLRLATGEEGSKLETQRMWAGVVKDGIERAEKKLDEIVKMKQMEALAPAEGVTPPAGAGPARAASFVPQNGGGSAMAATIAQQIFAAPVFRESILPELNAHMASQAPAVMTIQFLAGLASTDPRVNIFITWLFLRTWPQVLREALPHLDPASRELWASAAAQKWFDKARRLYYAQLRAQEEPEPEADAVSAPAPAAEKPPEAAPAPAPAPPPAAAGAPPAAPVSGT